LTKRHYNWRFACGRCDDLPQRNQRLLNPLLPISFA
jgi:hypothetical protein